MLNSRFHIALFVLYIYYAHLQKHFELGLIFGFKELSCCLYLWYVYKVVVNTKRHVRVSHLLMSFFVLFYYSLYNANNALSLIVIIFV